MKTIRINGKLYPLLREINLQLRLTLRPPIHKSFLKKDAPATVEYPVATEFLLPTCKLVFWQLEPCDISSKSAALDFSLFSSTDDSNASPRPENVLVDWSQRRIIELTGICPYIPVKDDYSGDEYGEYIAVNSAGLIELSGMSVGRVQTANAKRGDGTVTQICYRLDCPSDEEQALVETAHNTDALSKFQRLHSHNTTDAQVIKAPELTDGLVMLVSEKLRQHLDGRKVRKLPSHAEFFMLFKKFEGNLAKMVREYRWARRTLDLRKATINAFLKKNWGLSLEDFLMADPSIFRTAEKQMEDWRARRVDSRLLAGKSEDAED
jgi:hypothetical protein